MSLQDLTDYGSSPRRPALEKQSRRGDFESAAAAFNGAG